MSPLPPSIASATYSMARWPLRPMAEFWAFWTSRRRPERRLETEQRRGHALPDAPEGAWWLHGASAGEARLTLTLAEALQPRPLVLTAMTAQGREAQAASPHPGAFAPLDLPEFVRRSFDRWRPSLLVTVETELWPRLHGEAHRRSVPIVILNGRLSASRMERYRRWRGLYAPLLERVARIGARTEGDAERFVSLGARRDAVRVVGDLKFDAPTNDRAPAELRRRMGLDEGSPTIVAGSTREGEELELARCVAKLRRSHPDLRLLLAPRHLKRVDAIAAELAAEGLDAHRYSEGPAPNDAAILLIDAFGLLAELYALATIAFIGGTLAPIGGHNVIEAAAAGVPTVVGPHHATIREAVEELREVGALQIAEDPEAIEAHLGRWLSMGSLRDEAGDAARACIEAHRGALARSLELLEPFA